MHTTGAPKNILQDAFSLAALKEMAHKDAGIQIKPVACDFVWMP